MLITALIGAAALAAVTSYLVGLRSGERRGRDQAQSDLGALARAAAEESHQSALNAFERATGQAVERLNAAAESDRKLGREELARTTAPLRDALRRFRGLAEEARQQGAREAGKVQELARKLSTQMQGFQDGARSLRDALRGDRQARGRWGEVQLQTLVESAGLIEHADFDTQAGENGARPDLVLHLPGGARLPVDAKVPMDAYLAGTEEKDPARQQALFGRHAAAVKKHAKALAGRDYPAKLGEGPPLTVLFLPIESLLSEAIRHEPNLLQHAADHRIVLATPHTLLGLLWSVTAMWRRETSTRNAEEMRQAGLVLEQRLERFLAHLAAVGGKLRQTTEAWNGAVGSAETRLFPQLRRLRRLGGRAEEGRKAALPRPMGLTPRLPRPDLLPDRARREVA